MRPLFRKSDFLADDATRMETLNTKDNAKISERVSDFISSQMHALKPHRDDGKPRNEFMLYVWKSQPYEIGIGVYAPVLSNVSDDDTPEELISGEASDDYEAVMFYRNEIASLLTAEGFEYEMTNDGVTTSQNSFGRRPYATLTIYYGDDEMPNLTSKTLIMMGVRTKTGWGGEEYELAGDRASDEILDLWQGIADEIEFIMASARKHPDGATIMDAIETLDRVIR